MHTPNTFPNLGNTVLSPSGHTSTGSSLPAPAGVVAAEGGTPITLPQYRTSSAAFRSGLLRTVMRPDLARQWAGEVIGWQA